MKQLAEKSMEIRDTGLGSSQLEYFNDSFDIVEVTITLVLTVFAPDFIRQTVHFGENAATCI